MSRFVREGFLVGLLLWGCGDPAERHISQLVEGGASAEEAKIQLNLARGTATGPLIQAFQTRDHPARARADLAQALYRLYLREGDARILEALIGGLQDPNAVVRAGVVRALGDLNRPEGVGPLIVHLEREPTDEVRHEILAALTVMGMEEWESEKIETGKMTAEEKARFTATLTRLFREELSDSLRERTAGWLETLAQEIAVGAHDRLLSGDVPGAEARLLAARALIPESKNINQQLGRFYYENGDPGRGLEILSGVGVLTEAPELDQPPRIDGELEEPAWRDVTPLTEFYQCIYNLRAIPIEGKAEIYVGYSGNSLYVGIRGFEASTANLAANVTERDGRVSHDDCIEIFLDTNHDHRTYYQILVNSLGTIQDTHNDGNSTFGDFGWNGAYNVATSVADTAWTVEIEIPGEQLHQSEIESGDVWGFNVARVRISNASEYGQWAPTYGFAHRPDRFGFLVFQ